MAERTRWLGACSVGLGAVLQGWGAGRAWAGAATNWELALFGLGALAVGLGLSRLEAGAGRLLRWLYLALVVLLPPYGSLGAVFLFGFRRISRGTGLARDYADYIDAETAHANQEAAPPAGDSVDQMVQHELNVQSYMDIMRGPDRLLKKSLIGRILVSWTPNAVPLLRVALADEDYEIRSYASTALTEIESRMGENLLRCRARHEEGGGPVEGMRLAEAYLDYAASGLLDEATADHYVDRARAALTGVHLDEGEAGYTDWLTLCVQAAHADDDRAAERRACEELLSAQPDHADALRHLCELDFQEGRLADLPARAGQLLERIGDDHPSSAAARLWRDA